MKDEEMKLEDVKTPHTLVWASYTLLKFLNSVYDTLLQSDTLKPWGRENEECEYGEGKDVYGTLFQSESLGCVFTFQ